MVSVEPTAQIRTVVNIKSPSTTNNHYYEQDIAELNDPTAKPFVNSLSLPPDCVDTCIYIVYSLAVFKKSSDKV